MGSTQTCPGPHTLSPGRPCVCTSGSKGDQGTGCLASRAPTAEGASWGAWLPGEQLHKKTSLGELTAARGVLSSGAVPGADLCPSCWTLASVGPLPIATPLGPLCARTALSRGPRALRPSHACTSSRLPFQNGLLSERGPSLLRRGPPPFRLSVLPFLHVGIRKCESPSYLEAGSLGTWQPALVRPRISFLMR